MIWQADASDSSAKDIPHRWDGHIDKILSQWHARCTYRLVHWVLAYTTLHAIRKIAYADKLPNCNSQTLKWADTIEWRTCLLLRNIRQTDHTRKLCQNSNPVKKTRQKKKKAVSWLKERRLECNESSLIFDDGVWWWFLVWIVVFLGVGRPHEEEGV